VKPGSLEPARLSSQQRPAWRRSSPDEPTATATGVISPTTVRDHHGGSETRVSAAPLDMGDEMIAHQMPSAPPPSADARSTMHEIDPHDLSKTGEVPGLDATLAHPKHHDSDHTQTANLADLHGEPTEIGSSPAMLVDEDEMIVIAEDEEELIVVEEHHAKTVADEEHPKTPHETDRPRR
jgi:hypothetical protein